MQRFLARIGQTSARALAAIFSAIFGQVRWQPPRWLAAIGAGALRFHRERPRVSWSVLVLVLALAGGGTWGWRWYQNRPKPQYVTVSVGSIPVTKLEKELTFPPLTITFSASVAKLEDLKKPTLANVRLDPAITGNWYWSNDHTLIFRPTEDWPADKTIHVVFDRNFFPSPVRLEKLTWDAHTPAFEVTIKDLEFYQDPSNPTLRQITATFELSHSVDEGELERHVELEALGQSAVFPQDDPAPHYKLTYGPHHRQVFLRSSPVKLPEHEDFVKIRLTKGVRTSQGGAITQNDAETKLKIPSMDTMFRIDGSAGVVARNKANEPEQVIVLNTSTPIATRDLGKALEIYLLPKKKAEANPAGDDSDNDENTNFDSAANSSDDAADDSDGDAENEPDSDEVAEEVQSSLRDFEKWQSAADVPDDILAQAKKVQFTPLPSDKPTDTQHAFRVRVETDGELYIKVAKGLRAPGDYPLADDYAAVLLVPVLPREVQILSSTLGS